MITIWGSIDPLVLDRGLTWVMYFYCEFVFCRTDHFLWESQASWIVNLPSQSSLCVYFHRIPQGFHCCWTSLIFIPWFGIPVAHGECKFRHTCGWYCLKVDFSSRAPSRNRLFSLLSWAGGQSFLDSLRERASFPGPCLSIGISGLIPIECETQNHISCSEQVVKSRPRSLQAFYNSRPVLTASVEDPAFSLSPEDLPLFLLPVFSRTWLCLKIACIIFH